MTQEIVRDILHGSAQIFEQWSAFDKDGKPCLDSAVAEYEWQQDLWAGVSDGYVVPTPAALTCGIAGEHHVCKQRSHSTLRHGRKPPLKGLIMAASFVSGSYETCGLEVQALTGKMIGPSEVNTIPGWA